MTVSNESTASLSELTALRDVLLGAAEFEPAAEGVLRLMLQRCAAALASSGVEGRVLRGMVHLRPAGAYRSLVVLEHEAASAGDTLLPSATVWALVERSGLPTEVDVHLRRATRQGHAPVELQRPEARADDVFASRHRLIERSATHILAVPLRTRQPSSQGMISIEIDARSAIGRTLTVGAGARPLGDLIDRLQLMADLAAARLVSLPLCLPRSGKVQPDRLLPVIGSSMQRQMEMLRRFARQDETLLLCGPTGSGKSRLAEWCHGQSPRAHAQFECGDLLHKSDEMQMAELFGWRRGAFTGAVGDHEGLVARVEGGTLFIDEIDKLSIKAQHGLLRFLETRRYRRMGDPGPERESDVRIIVGTNADLDELVATGQFREDLLYRINVLPVRLPPLSERKDEIAPWAEFMARRRHEAAGLSGTVRLSASAGVTLMAYDWPGNLRQLDNVIRRAHVIAVGEGDLASDDVSLEITTEHIERAMGFERGQPQHHVLLEAMRAAAYAFAAEAVTRHTAGGEPLNLELADALRGLTLAAGLRITGDKEETMRVLGRESLLAGRNHHKVLRREHARVIELCEALGHVPRPEDLPGLDD